MAYDDFKEGCSVIKDYVDDQNKETAGKIPTKVSELTNDSNYATESYVNTAIGNIAQPTSLPQTYKKKAVTLATSGWVQDANIKIADNDNVQVLSSWTIVKIGHTDLVDSFNTSTSLSFDSGLYNTLIPTRTATVDKAIADGNIVNWYSNFKTSNNVTQLILKVYTRDFSSYQKGDIVAEYNPNSASSPGIAGTDNIKVFCSGIGTKQYINTYTDADVKVNSEVRFTLDEANGKLAGQFGLKKTIDKEAGKLTFTADTLPTSAITGTLEIGETSTEGAAFVEGIVSDSTGFVKTTEENTFTKTQTFNGTESQAGIKTNAIDNENGNRVVYFNGTKQMFGSGAIPSQVRTSEQRLKLERPVSGGTGTEIVEIANLADVSGGGAIKGKEIDITTRLIYSDSSKRFTLSTAKNYATATASSALFMASYRGALRLEVGKTYKLQYWVSAETKTTVYAAASSTTLSDGTTVVKAEFSVNGKTLVVVDRATAGVDITGASSLTWDGTSAIVYFSDYSTVTETLYIDVFTVPLYYQASITFDDDIPANANVVIYARKNRQKARNVFPLIPNIDRTATKIVLQFGIADTAAYSLTGAEPDISLSPFDIVPSSLFVEVTGTVADGSLADYQTSLAGFAENNTQDWHRVLKVADWTTITGGFQWKDSTTKKVVWNSEVEFFFYTEADRQAFEAAGCKVVKSDSIFADYLTITCTTKPTKPISFTYTVKNTAR